MSQVVDPSPPGRRDQLSGCRAKGGLYHTRHKRAFGDIDHQSGSPRSSCRTGSVWAHHP
jgi:hypothetical protein